MTTSEAGRGWLAGTRGRIVRLLRKAGATVNDLAATLELTDNAVRAHLSALERDGLVRSTGTRRGVRKPHQTYGLTPEAEDLFPKAYGPVLCELLAVLSERLPEPDVESVAREVGRRLAATDRDGVRGQPFEARVARVVEALGNLGGLAECEEREDCVLVRGASCPLAAAARCAPTACLAAEALVEEIAGQPTRERCERGETPRCAFQIQKPDAPPLPAGG